MASKRDMIWYRATVVGQSYSAIIEDMARLGHVVTIEEIRAIVAEARASRAAALTVADLERTLEDDRHLGFGFAEIRYVDDEAVVQAAKETVVATANGLGLDYEGLFKWSNSKLGRWLCDSLGGAAVHEVPQLVAQMLNISELEKIGVVVL